MDKQELVSLLKNHGVPVERFGTSTFKTIEHLVREIEAGESVLSEQDGRLLRSTSILYITVECWIGDQSFRLREDRQIFTDGRLRRRPFLHGSVAEKLKAGESPDQKAVIRALQEELGIDRVRSAQQAGITVLEEDSPSYPGLRARFTNHLWRVTLHPEDFQPEGYTEVQPDKTTYFVWDEI